MLRTPGHTQWLQRFAEPRNGGDEYVGRLATRGASCDDMLFQEVRVNRPVAWAVVVGKVLAGPGSGRASDQAQGEFKVGIDAVGPRPGGVRTTDKQCTDNRRLHQ